MVMRGEEREEGLAISDLFLLVLPAARAFKNKFNNTHTHTHTHRTPKQNKIKPHAHAHTAGGKTAGASQLTSKIIATPPMTQRAAGDLVFTCAEKTIVGPRISVL